MPGLRLRTAAWYGDSLLDLEFPNAWDIQALFPQTPPPLSDEEIRGALEMPVGQPPIRQSCQGRTRPLVIVDDLNRPTPAARVMPFVLRHFRDAGIPYSQVTVLMARGTHGLPCRDGMLKKIGAEASSFCRVLIHDPARDVVKIGRTSYGTPVLVNQEVVASDFIVGIGGVYPNNTAGFGGGSKLALGVLDVRAISYLHHRHRSVGWGSSQTEGTFRDDLDQIARMIRLHSSITMHVNADREVVRLRCGDSFQFYAEEVAFARETFRAPLPEGVDVVISNAYPNDLSLTFLCMKGLVPLRACAARTSRIAIASCSEGLGSHGVYPVVNVPRFHEQRDLVRRISVTSPKEIAQKFERLFWRAFHRGTSNGDAAPQVDSAAPRPENPIWLYRTGTHPENFPSSIRDIQVRESWSEILEEVQREQGGRDKLRVVVYPCAPLQILVESGTEIANHTLGVNQIDSAKAN